MAIQFQNVSLSALQAVQKHRKPGTPVRLIFSNETETDVRHINFPDRDSASFELKQMIKRSRHDVETPAKEAVAERGELHNLLVALDN